MVDYGQIDEIMREGLQMNGEVCFCFILFLVVYKLIRHGLIRKFDQFDKWVDRHVIPVAEADRISGTDNLYRLIVLGHRHRAGDPFIGGSWEWL